MPRPLRNMQVNLRGIRWARNGQSHMEDGLIKVVSPIDETPAAKAVIMANDIVGRIDDEPVQGIALNQAVRQDARSGKRRDYCEIGAENQTSP